MKIEIPEALQRYKREGEEKEGEQSSYENHRLRWCQNLSTNLDKRLKAMAKVGCHPGYIIMGYSTWLHATGWIKGDFSPDRKTHVLSELPIVVDMTVAETLRVAPRTDGRVQMYLNPPATLQQEFMHLFLEIKVEA